MFQNETMMLSYMKTYLATQSVYISLYTPDLFVSHKEVLLINQSDSDEIYMQSCQRTYSDCSFDFHF